MFVFTGIPFGINIAPQAFMKVMRVVTRHLSQQGIRIFLYTDDMLLISDSREDCALALKIVLQIGKNAGFCVKHDKSILEPTQIVEFAGVTADFSNGSFCIPSYKRKSYRRELGQLLTRTHVSLRKLASVFTRVRSLLVCFPGLRVLSDHLVSLVQTASFVGYETVVAIPGDVKAQVCMCKSYLSSWEERPMEGRLFTRSIAVDASGLELAAIDTMTAVQQAHAFVQDPHTLHRNEKELLAADLGACRLCLPSDVVELTVGNSVSFYYIKKQKGRKSHLNDLLSPLLLFCWSQGINIVPK